MKALIVFALLVLLPVTGCCIEEEDTVGEMVVVLTRFVDGRNEKLVGPSVEEENKPVLVGLLEVTGFIVGRAFGVELGPRDGVKDDVKTGFTAGCEMIVGVKDCSVVGSIVGSAVGSVVECKEGMKDGKEEGLFADDDGAFETIFETNIEGFDDWADNGPTDGYRVLMDGADEGDDEDGEELG